MEEDNNISYLFLDDVNDRHKTLLHGIDSPPTPKCFPRRYSLVVIRDHSDATKGAGGDDFSVFPPSKHENLVPSDSTFDSNHRPPFSPCSSFSFPSSDFDGESPSPSPSPPPPAVTTLFPKWWNFAVQILRSRIMNKRSFWSLKNVALAVTLVLWWLCMRSIRQGRRRKNVKHLMQIINEKDKKIMQLLNQIAQMNEVLLTRHKVLASKLAN